MAENDAVSGGSFCRTLSTGSAAIRTQAANRRKGRSTPPRRGNMPGTRTVSRCAQCGTILQTLAEPLSQCPKCGFDLHSCKQCEHFDPSSRFECNQPIPARISPKDKKNDCTFYSIRVSLEKETSSKGMARPNDARQAFDNLFKK